MDIKALLEFATPTTLASIYRDYRELDMPTREQIAVAQAVLDELVANVGEEEAGQLVQWCAGNI